jgi:hypothetical protein
VQIVVVVLVTAALACMAAAAALPAENGAGSEAQNPIVRRVLTHRAGPTALALALALLALPLVAVSLDAVSTANGAYLGSNPPRLGLTDPARWAGAAGAVMTAALVSGTIGGLIVRKHRKIGALVAFVLGWQVAIAALPVLPALLNLNVGFAYFCIDSCGPAIQTSDLGTPLFYAVMPWTLELSALLAPLPFVVLAVGVIAWKRIL